MGSKEGEGEKKLFRDGRKQSLLFLPSFLAPISNGSLLIIVGGGKMRESVWDICFLPFLSFLFLSGFYPRYEYNFPLRRLEKNRREGGKNEGRKGVRLESSEDREKYTLFPSIDCHISPLLFSSSRSRLTCEKGPRNLLLLSHPHSLGLQIF